MIFYNKTQTHSNSPRSANPKAPIKWRLSLQQLTIVLLLFFGAFNLAAADSTTTHTIDINQVSQADVDVSPDGKYLYFTALGQIFKLPIAGGRAEQLTFGPYFHSSPAVSPDNLKLTFISDRDSDSNGSVFVMDLKTKKLTQLTKNRWAARPAWSPDGSVISYLDYRARGPWAQQEFVGADGIEAQIRQVSVNGLGDIAITNNYSSIRSVFFFSDGAMGWVVTQATSKRHPPKSLIFKSKGFSAPKKVATIPGVVDWTMVSRDGNELLLRLFKSADEGDFSQQDEKFLAINFKKKQTRTVDNLVSVQPRPKFSNIDNFIVFSEGGQLWKKAIDGQSRQAIPFNAKAKIEAFPPIQARPYTPRNELHYTYHSLRYPAIYADKRNLFFSAEGIIWKQELNQENVNVLLTGGNKASRFLERDGIQWGNFALSPNGKYIAYQITEGNLQNLIIHDLKTGHEETVSSTERAGEFQPTWSRNSEKLVYVKHEDASTAIFTFNTRAKQTKKIVNISNKWSARPGFYNRDQDIYFSQNNRVLRQNLNSNNANTEVLFSLPQGQIADARISTDGKWLAFRRNKQIWLQDLDERLGLRPDPKVIHTKGVSSFDFAVNSDTLLFSVDDTFYQHEPGQRTQKISVAIDGSIPVKSRVLIKNVRYLDYETGNFSNETSILMEDGKISFIGDIDVDPANTLYQQVDAKGKFAIPGLIDLNTRIAKNNDAMPISTLARTDAFIGFGITSVLDTGSGRAELNSLRDQRINSGAKIPRLFSSGPRFENGQYETNQQTPLDLIWHGNSELIDNSSDYRDIAKARRSEDLAMVFKNNSLTWPMQRALNEETRNQGLPSTTNAFTLRETIMAAILGNTHLLEQPVSTQIYSDVFKLMAANNLNWSPSVGTSGGNLLLYKQQGHLFSEPYLMETSTKAQRELKATDTFLQLNQASYAQMLNRIAEARRNGVRVLISSEAFAANTFYGQSLHLELMHHKKSGMSELSLLRLATLDAARALGAERYIGSIEKGKLADIVLLDLNPLDDISNTRYIWKVILGGVVQ